MRETHTTAIRHVRDDEIMPLGSDHTDKKYCIVSKICRMQNE